jgi:hypothetical protein
VGTRHSRQRLRRGLRSPAGAGRGDARPVILTQNRGCGFGRTESGLAGKGIARGAQPTPRREIIVREGK